MSLPPEEVLRFQTYLTTHAAAYLTNTIRDPGVTCSVCAAPVDGYSRCYQCNQHHFDHGAALADRVGCVTYAATAAQSGRVMFGYKARPTVREHLIVVASLAWVAISRHTTCVATLTGSSVTHWATVPSLRDPSREHPLHQIVEAHSPAPAEAVLLAAPGVATRRDIGTHFVSTESVPANSHVMLIDDSWVSGGHAQSAALTLRSAGAGSISVLTIARWLKPGWGPTDEFVKTRLSNRDYDPATCPWTGGACPP